MIRQNSLYIFQKDFYNIQRFLSYIAKKYLTLRSKQLGHVDYTTKVKLLITLSIIGQILSITATWLTPTEIYLHIIITLVIITAYPLYLVLAQVIILPLEYILKQRIIRQAKEKLQTLKNIHIIGIVGSYGKTSTKHVLYHTYKNIVPTITTSGNTNTLLGVANFILQEVQPHHQVMIVEMGEHYTGDIKDLCNLLDPKTIVVAWLTLQHAERMGDIDHIEKVLFEFRGHPSVQHVLINADDPNLQKLKNKYPSDNYTNVEYITSATNIETQQNFAWIQWNYEGYNIQTRLLGKHSSIFIMMALHIAKHLKLDIASLIAPIQNIPYIEHRLQLMYNPVSDIYVIDDSYNGNIQWVRVTIQLIKDSNFDGKKIYITPWLMELGSFADTIHTEMAHLIHDTFDLILLIENTNTQLIYRKLIELGENQDKIIMFANRDEAHTQLKKYTSHHSVIIFQNDIPQWF